MILGENEQGISPKADKIRNKGGWLVSPTTFQTIFESDLIYYPIRLLLASGKIVNCYFDVLEKRYCKFSLFGVSALNKSRPIAFQLRKVKKKVDKIKIIEYN